MRWQAAASPAKGRGRAVALRLSPRPSPRAPRGAVAGVGARPWVRMCLGREAAWHARQQLCNAVHIRRHPALARVWQRARRRLGKEGGGGGWWRAEKGAWEGWKKGRWVLCTPLCNPSFSSALGYDGSGEVGSPIAAWSEMLREGQSAPPSPLPLPPPTPAPPHAVELGRSVGMGDAG